MKRLMIRSLALAMTGLALTLSIPTEPGVRLGFSFAKAESHQPTNPCAPPNEISASPEQTAWELWVAATCPVNQSQYPYVVWENWIEQNQMYPVDPTQGLVLPNSGERTDPFRSAVPIDPDQ